MDIFGNLANAASSIAKGGSASDALQVAGEATLNDVLGGSKIPSAAPSPTANVSVAPGVAASPVVPEVPPDVPDGVGDVVDEQAATHAVKTATARTARANPTLFMAEPSGNRRWTLTARARPWQDTLGETHDGTKSLHDERLRRASAARPRPPSAARTCRQSVRPCARVRASSLNRISTFLPSSSRVTMPSPNFE